MTLITRRSAIQSLSIPLLTGRAHAQVTPDLVNFAPEIEPLVALIERTPREKSAEMLAAQLKSGVSYRQLMAALFLAGVRNVNPRPPGFALHCVFVIHSAHLLGMEAAPESFLLPLFYAMHTFKASQERDARGNDYTMRAIRGSLPSPSAAASEFMAAMEAWDTDRAERAVVSLCRHRSASETLDLLWRYGVRDYRNIGHKAIFVANAERTLHAIGWQHAEPVLRSLVLGLLDFGQEQKVNGYAFADQCYTANTKRVAASLAKLDSAWAAKPADAETARTIVKAIREATPDEACASVLQRLLKGTAGAQAVWDAVHLAAAELRIRVSAGAVIVGVHAVTAANGLHHAYEAASDPAVRLLALLQAVGWMAQFRSWAETRQENIRSFSITEMEPGGSGPVREIFESSAGGLDAAAASAMRLARSTEGARDVLNTSIQCTIAKADEVHYYKYVAALAEDIPLVSPVWRPHLTAAVVYYTKGLKDPEPDWAKSARAVLA